MSDFTAGDRITNDKGLIVVAQMGPDDLAPGWRLYAKAGEFVVGDSIIGVDPMCELATGVHRVVEVSPSPGDQAFRVHGNAIWWASRAHRLATPKDITPVLPAIDITSIRKGDTVGIDFEVRNVIGESLELKPVSVRRGDFTASLSLLTLPSFWVMRHEPAPPKPIKVGDRVVYRRDKFTLTGKVLHLSSGEACVLSNDGFMFVYDCDSLEHA